MADRYWAKLEICGEITPEQLGKLIDILREEDIFTETMSNILKGNCKIEHEDGDAKYGQFDELEQKLIKAEIPFIRHTASYAEYPAYVFIFDGKNIKEFNTDSTGDPIISVSGLIAMKEKKLTLEQVIESISFKKLPPLSIKK